MPKKNGFTNNGFTLIELMVSMSIIAILSAIGLIVYSTAIKQGQDARRQSDLRSIQSALEQYYSDQGYYPAAGTSCTNGAFKFGCALKDPTGKKTYLNTIPTDPTGSPEYSYTALPISPAICDNSAVNGNCNNYSLCAKLANTSSVVGSCEAGGSYNFTVGPP
ncbi:MAG: type II secretion system GspH family protein [Patescibacteria group bacterium]|nr:type II secretion system GspH family protein [Patescibacteria group bacterium]